MTVRFCHKHQILRHTKVVISVLNNGSSVLLLSLVRDVSPDRPLQWLPALWTTMVLTPAGAEVFFARDRFQVSASSRRVNQPEREADISPASSVDVETPVPLSLFATRLHYVVLEAQGQLYCTSFGIFTKADGVFLCRQLARRVV
jgi:hypothetical protein